MKAIMKAAMAFLMISNGCVTSSAQINIPKYEWGINAGILIYQGDLTPERLGSYRTMKPVVGVYMNKIMNPLFSLRTNLSFGTLKGDDSKYAVPQYRQQRNFNFRSPVFELSELLVVDILQKNMAKQGTGVSPYLFTGIGFSYLKITRDWSRFNGEYFATESKTIEGLAADAQHSLPKLIPVLPIGLGIKFAFSQKFMINAETSYRLTFTDYLDGFSKAANDSRKDSYQSHTVGIVYRFSVNNNMKCPTF